tara:strand:+ start:9941 stop:11698 length:1758 start_codon:yes stop_codon:yes gene_type:complete
MSNLKLVTDHSSLFNMLYQLWKFLGRRRKIQLLLLLIMMILASFAEVLSLGAVIPFLGVIASPESLFNMPLAQPFIKFFDITEQNQLLVTFGLIFVGCVLVSAIFRTILLRLSITISFRTGSELSIDAFRNIINQPYSDHLNQNTSELISVMGPKLNNAISVINNVLIFVSSVLITIGILSILLSLEPLITIILLSVFSIIYILMTFFFRSRLIYNSKRAAELGPLVIKTLQEALGGIRNIILDTSHKEFVDIYKKDDVSFRAAQANTTFISNSPRPILEALAIVLIVLLAYVFSLQPGGIQGSIPILGFMALGAQRLLPNLQQSYAAWSYIKGEQRSLQDVLEILAKSKSFKGNRAFDKKIIFQEKIHLKGLSFRYSEGLPYVLRDFELEIKRGSWLGIIGETGSGKSTLIDIIAGLLKPSVGGLYVDGDLVGKDVSVEDWQTHIAHVPQVIFLSDASISCNIAFGIHPDEIDHDLVKKSAEIAQLAETIDEFPNGYQTVVGERGARISGGQRQRIGIARALYRKASVLILDEATNALDSQKELKVIEALKNLDHDITVIMIAHRLSTLENCNNIIDIRSNSIS